MNEDIKMLSSLVALDIAYKTAGGSICDCGMPPTVYLWGCAPTCDDCVRKYTQATDNKEMQSAKKTREFLRLHKMLKPL